MRTAPSRTGKRSFERLGNRRSEHQELKPQDTYKTILCKYYELGTCKSGDKCNFAHGKEELVKLELPKIEKVEPRIEVGYTLYTLHFWMSER